MGMPTTPIGAPIRPHTPGFGMANDCLESHTGKNQRKSRLRLSIGPDTQKRAYPDFTDIPDNYLRLIYASLEA